MDIRSMAEIALVVLSTLMVNRVFWKVWSALVWRTFWARDFDGLVFDVLYEYGPSRQNEIQRAVKLARKIAKEAS